jgi:hypothetical protein
MALAQRDIDDRWRLYEGMAAMDRSPTLGKES